MSQFNDPKLQRQQAEFDSIAAELEKNQNFWHDEGAFTQTPKDVTEDVSFDDEWGGVYRPTKGVAPDYDELLKDESVVQELCKKDPAFKARHDEEQRNRVVSQFRAAEPDYLPTPKNYKAMCSYIRRNVLKDTAEHVDLEDVFETAYAKGVFTVPLLQKAYSNLSIAGHLEMPAGKPKELSAADKIAVLAKVRAANPEGAIIEYYIRSFDGKAPREFHSHEDIWVSYPELLTAASWFIFEAMHSHELAADELRAFKQSMKRHKLPTVRMLESALQSWLLNPTTAPKETKEAAPKELTQKEIENMTDEEINQRIVEAQREYQRQRWQ
jgi:hypothetical protein